MELYNAFEDFELHYKIAVSHIVSTCTHADTQRFH